MKNKFIILDRDGVINVEKNYLYKIEDFEYEKEVIEGLLNLKEKGYKFAVITNQAGIAKGYYTEDDYKKLENYISNDLLEKGIKIEKFYYCPHHPEGKDEYKIICECRKPNIGNFLKAINELNIDVKNSYMLGDRISDLLPANKLGMKTVLMLTGYGKENLNKLKENNLEDCTFNSILEFSKSI